MTWYSVRGALVSGVTALVFAGAAGLSAAEHAVSLLEAETLALEQSPRISVARDSLARAQARVTQTRGGLLPSVTASGSYTRNLEKPAISFPNPATGDDMTVEMGMDNDYQFGFTGTQPIFLGFAGVTGYRMARLGAESAELQVEETLQSVLQSVRTAYMTAVLSRRLVEVQEEAVAQAESSLVQTKRQYDVGSASRFDLLRAQVQLSNTRPGLISARSNRKLADAQLRTAIGVDPDVVIVPTDTLKVFRSRWQDMAYDSLLSVAYVNRPDIRQLGYVQETASYGIDLARSSYYPVLAVFGRTQWQQLVPDEWHRTSAIGVQLNWNLWDSWKRNAQVQEARVGVRQVESVRTLMKHGVALEVESAHRSLDEAWTSLESLAETVEQAAEALRLARVLYGAGGSTQLDIIGAQLALTQAQTQHASALYQYHVAHIQLEKALGLIRSGKQGV
jgi:outer membrane protein